MKSQCFHEKEKHQGIFKMEMKKLIIALPLKSTIAYNILRHWIWLSLVFKTALINQVTYKNLESLLLKVANQTDYSTELQEVAGMISMRLILLHNHKSYQRSLRRIFNLKNYTL